MKVAIHHTPGSFSDRWLEYCKGHHIDVETVDCYDSNIIRRMDDCDGLMWHWPHWDTKAALFARQLTYTLELAGKSVFPDSRTCWHYDDKLGQKYLLEAMGAPLVPTTVFYDKPAALAWLERTDFPKVFKLRRGAGSANVFLAGSRRQARRLVGRAFGRGFPAVSRKNLFRDRLWHLRRDKDLSALIGLGKGFARLFIPTEIERKTPKEKGYVYFQDFVPANAFDIRIVVIGHRAFGIKRMVRAHDFRASGSGSLHYAKDDIDMSCVVPSFEISRKLGTQCLAFDYLYEDGRPVLTEISYAFVQTGYGDCPGYWDESLIWHEGQFYPEWFIAEDFVRRIRNTRGPGL